MGTVKGWMAPDSLSSLHSRPKVNGFQQAFPTLSFPSCVGQNTLDWRLHSIIFCWPICKLSSHPHSWRPSCSGHVWRLLAASPAPCERAGGGAMNEVKSTNRAGLSLERAVRAGRPSSGAGGGGWCQWPAQLFWWPADGMQAGGVLCVVTIIIKIEISTLAAEVVLALLATVMRMGGRERGRGRGQWTRLWKWSFPVRTAPDQTG